MDRMLLRTSEAMEALGIGRTKFYELIASGEIPTRRIGRAVRIPVDALRRWVEQNNERETAGKR